MSVRSGKREPASARLPAFERDPYLRSLDVEVLETGADGGRVFAVLDDTILYPEGGGQPADHGHLDGRPVVDVQRSDGEIRHVFEAGGASCSWPRGVSRPPITPAPRF